jgi:hypothetical protein
LKSKNEGWNILLNLIGKWQGDIAEQSGIGKGTLEFKQVLKNNYIFYKNEVIFQPKNQGEEGEIHEEWGFFSIDNSDNSVKLRAFFGEGHISYYSLIDFNLEKKQFVFQTKHNENLPEKFLAKLTIELDQNNIFREKLELAPNGKEYKMCIETEWKKTS